jgi:hypothetical protein
LVFLIVGVALFAVGCVLAARPWVRRRTTWLVAVPLAAVLGMLAFGILALVVVAVVEGWADYYTGSVGGTGKSRRAKSRASSP